MTPDDILEDMANELIVHKYNTIKSKKHNFSLLKTFALWVQNFYPKHNSLKETINALPKD